MAFININKVTLEETNDGKVAISNVLLMLASLLHDSIAEKDYATAQHHLDMLKCSVVQMDMLLSVSTESKVDTCVSSEGEEDQLNEALNTINGLGIGNIQGGN